MGTCCVECGREMPLSRAMRIDRCADCIWEANRLRNKRLLPIRIVILVLVLILIVSCTSYCSSYW